MSIGGRGDWGNAVIQPGEPNTGGGGGGAQGQDLQYSGRPGGSGVVIIRYSSVAPDASETTGNPTFTNSGGFKMYRFTVSGTIKFADATTAVYSYLVVGGGGGGGDRSLTPSLSTLTPIFEYSNPLLQLRWRWWRWRLYDKR